MAKGKRKKNSPFFSGRTVTNQPGCPEVRRRIQPEVITFLLSLAKHLLPRMFSSVQFMTEHAHITNCHNLISMDRDRMSLVHILVL